jgi:DNA (cytosine-5)-methyltransferase 1
MKGQLRSIELFSGAGGLALGISQAGFAHRLLLEYNKDACATIRRNRRFFGETSCQIEETDVHTFDFRPYAGVDLLAAGAPCQPFSIGGKHRAHRDERNLFPEVFRAVRELHPKAVVIENVRGLLRPGLSEFVEYVTLQLTHPSFVSGDPIESESWQRQLPSLRKYDRQRQPAGDSAYRVHQVLLNAANFGVPQKRDRVFFVALRADVDGLWRSPFDKHTEAALRLAQYVTGAYWKSHGMNRKVTPNHPKLGQWTREAGKSLPWRTVRDALAKLPPPAPRGSSGTVPNHVSQPGARVYPGHTGSPLDEPAKTLKAGVHGVPGGENMLRNQNGSVRYFTVREAARLQTFPDNYIFEGAWGEAMRQIGNAVPVALARAVADSIKSCLEGEPDDAARRRALVRVSMQEAFPGF